MTQEALKLALEAMNAMLTHMGMDEDEWNKVTFDQMRQAIKAAEEALAQTQEPIVGTKTWFEDGKVVTQHLTAKDIYKEPEQEPVAVYGYCPECGAKGVTRERRPNGNDKCAKGHTYPSNTATHPQRTWVGLTKKEVHDLYDADYVVFHQRIEAKLKEKNT